MSAAAQNGDIKRAARDWVVRLSDDTTPAAFAEFAAWQSADPRHQAAFRRYEMLWNDVADLPELNALLENESAGDTALLAGLEHEDTIAEPTGSTSPWRFVSSLRGLAVTATALAAMLIVALVLPGQMSTPGTDGGDTNLAKAVTTETAEIRDITLDDGSVVTLGARSRIETAFSDDARRVILAEGEAFFDVVGDPNRPFIVEAGDTIVEVRGTKFDVRRGGDVVRVAVLEGIVEVTQNVRTDSAAGETSAGVTQTISRTLTGGEALVADVRAVLSNPAPVAAIAPGAWREGRLVYVDAPLAQVVADANRYTNRPIEIEDPALRALSVSASFRTDAIEDLVATLDASLPVVADRSSLDRIVLRPSDK